jgi:hypothetical protein
MQGQSINFSAGLHSWAVILAKLIMVLKIVRKPPSHSKTPEDSWKKIHCSAMAEVFCVLSLKSPFLRLKFAFLFSSSIVFPYTHSNPF